MKNGKKIAFWVVTGLLAAIMIGGGAFNYIFNHEAVAEGFTRYGFPTWLIYPMAVAKILGILAITLRFNHTIKEWAYAGLFYNSLLAVGAHVAISDGEQWGAVVAVILTLASYWLQKDGLDSKG